MTRMTTPATLALMLVLTTTTAYAQDVAEQPTVTATAEPSPTIKLGAEAMTSFPIQVGGRLWIEVPGRVRFGTSLGGLPGGYESAINSVLVGAGAYDQQTGDLVSAALSSSLVWRAELGWRPFADLGGYIDVGYALATVGGELSLDELGDALDQPALTSINNLPGSYSLSGLLHMVTVELGWQWRIDPGLTIRAAAGAAISVAANVEIEAGGSTAQNNRAAALVAAGEALAEQTLTKYAVTPMISLAVGWQIYPF